MAKGPFSPTQFTATQFDSAEVKAAFGNHFLHFVASDSSGHCSRSRSTTAFRCASHIFAHHNVFGFYETWFADDRAKLSFLVHTLRFPCYGDPAFTYSDVEREIQREIRRTTLVSDYQRRVEAATRNRELAELERLQAKYLGQAAVHPPLAVDPARAQRVSGAAESLPDTIHVPAQAMLF